MIKFINFFIYTMKEIYSTLLQANNLYLTDMALSPQ